MRLGVGLHPHRHLSDSARVRRARLLEQVSNVTVKCQQIALKIYNWGYRSRPACAVVVCNGLIR